MGTLYIVATPIGNLEDVTLRALRILREADAIFAEDTRRTRVLLDHFEIAARPISLHAHNEAARVDRVLETLADHGRVALVSDAGSPLVSDPGARLVAAVAQAGHRVEPIPGPSALVAALSVSGLDTDRVLFLGFLPRKAGARRRLLEAQRGRPESLVVFESPHRVAATLAEVAEILGDPSACLARELTKRHEEVSRAKASELARRCEAEPPRGECTLVIAGAADGEAGVGEWDDGALDEAIRAALADGDSTRDLARALARQSGRPRSEVYARALALRDGGAPDARGRSDAPRAAIDEEGESE